MNNPRERVVIVGGPSRGKSTTADELRNTWKAHGLVLPVFCGDPASKVVYQKPYTTYLPEGLPFAGDDGAAAYVAERWFGDMEGPWICEGHVMARALRRWKDMAERDRGEGNLQTDMDRFPCDRIIVLDRPAHRPTSRGQEAMHKGVMKVWDEIEDYYAPITEWRR